MNNYKPYLFAFLLIAAIAGGVFLNRSCKREKLTPAEPKSSKEEMKRQHIVVIDTTERAKFRKLSDDYIKQIRAIKSALKVSERERKAAEQNAINSFLKYKEVPTLKNCDKALTDCMEENETQSYSLAVQNRMISGQDSLIGLQVSEMNRQLGVIDTLNTGWEAANSENVELQKKLAKEKDKRFGLGAYGGYGATKTGFSPSVGVSVNYNLWKF